MARRQATTMLGTKITSWRQYTGMWRRYNTTEWCWVCHRSSQCRRQCANTKTSTHYLWQFSNQVSIPTVLLHPSCAPPSPRTRSDWFATAFSIQGRSHKRHKWWLLESFLATNFETKTINSVKFCLFDCTSGDWRDSTRWTQWVHIWFNLRNSQNAGNQRHLMPVFLVSMIFCSLKAVFCSFFSIFEHFCTMFS